MQSQSAMRLKRVASSQKNHQRHTTSAMLVASALTCLAGAPATLQAQTAASTTSSNALQNFEIPAQPLSQALGAFASQTSKQVLFNEDELATRQSNAINGQYSPRQALESLLAGTGISISSERAGGFVLRPTPTLTNISAGDSNADSLPEVVITAASMHQETENSGSYTTSAISVGTKLETSLRETPRSVSVMTRQQLDDQQIASLDEVMNQLPGVTVIPSSGYTASSYYSRGYQITSFLTDGAPAATYDLNDASVNAGMSKYDSVQLLRGPDGLFSGNGVPSGSVNMVRKKPFSHKQFKTTLSAGRWNNYFADADLTGPLTDSGRIRGRVVASHNDREYFFDGAHRKNSSLYGIVEVDLTSDSLLTIGGSHDRERGSGRSTPPTFPRYSNGEPISIPRNQGYSSWSFSDLDTKNVFAKLEHQINDQWRAQLNVSRTETTLESNVSSYVGQVNPITGLGSTIFPGTWAEGDYRTNTADAYITGKFNALGRQHQVIFGADYRDSRAETPQFNSTASSVAITDWTSVDPNALVPSNSRGNLTFITSGKTRQSGLYANGKFQVVGPLHVVLGGRYATYRLTGDSRYASAASNPVETNKSDDIFTPYYALTFDFSEKWSGFITHAESYEDQSSRYTAELKPLDPITGDSLEIGIKGELFDGRLNTSAVLYRTKRHNYAVRESTATDFNITGRSCCWVGSGEFLSQGIELDLSGQLAPGWEINGGYTFDDNKTEYGNSKGKRYASYTPRHTLRFWTSYQLHDRLAGWRIGGGVKMQSSFFRSGNVPTWNPTGGEDGTGAYDGPSESYAFTDPGRAIWNSFVEYRINRNWTAALNIDNLFDKKYFQSVGGTRNWYDDGSFYGEPRNVRFTLRGTFD